MSNLSGKLKFLLERSGYLSKDVAEKAGITPQYFSHLITQKRDNPDRAIIESFAQIFDVPLAYFYTNLEDDSTMNVAARASALAEVMDEAGQKVLRDVLEDLSARYLKSEVGE